MNQRLPEDEHVTNKAKKSGSNEPKFEKDLERLEAIVEALEEGGLPLDEALKKFEEGIKLAQRCEKNLSAAEKKIELLTRNAGGELSAEPFGDGDDEGPGAETPGEDAGDEEGGTLLF